jgi:hypothetical protein
MRKIFTIAALALSLAGCNQQSINSSIIQTTQNIVALNNALVQVNATILDNVIAQAKILAPYQCGAFALAKTIVNSSTAAAKVNAYLAKNVAAGVTVVAVTNICTALGYGPSVTAAPASSVPATVNGN